MVAVLDVFHLLPRALRRGLLAQAAERVKPGGMLVLKDISPRRSGGPMPTG